ncbi:GmrSD restriction endonuclease domain-containing protein [Rhizobium ruizarguesonis]|uniref:GmrSD restriction endonuclease domain-containing protein n=1 Tax=Rhizobium ruizarguesonis TaxID=2081791 RepID=UPI0013EE84B7|nr:DUF262 domain-containing protein [Rhizobium ruizarguesonis]
MEDDKPLFEIDPDAEEPDPDETPIKDRKVFTQPYDLAVESLVDQIRSGTIFLRPLTEKPRFQRQYVWTNNNASKLIESIILNVPIPPCYLSQNDDFELDVIDGQQRLYSIYRFVENQFELSNLEVISEFNGDRFFELSPKIQRQIKTHTLRCVLITNESHPEVKFDVFERLNTNTVPLNAQELRNCVYRGTLNLLLNECSEYQSWLKILGKSKPDKRLRDEELILRFFAFHNLGLESYRTPQKHWLNDAAKDGRRFSEQKIAQLQGLWRSMINTSLVMFDARECFRRSGSRAVNRALFDLIAYSLKNISQEQAEGLRVEFRVRFLALGDNIEFQDLISRAVDHKKRTNRRFEIWQNVMAGLF